MKVGPSSDGKTDEHGLYLKADLYYHLVVNQFCVMFVCKKEVFHRTNMEVLSSDVRGQRESSVRGQRDSNCRA